MKQTVLRIVNGMGPPGQAAGSDRAVATGYLDAFARAPR